MNSQEFIGSVRYAGSIPVIFGRRKAAEVIRERRLSPSLRLVDGFRRAEEGREPYSEPLTITETVDIFVSRKRYDLANFARVELPRRIAWRLPRRVALWAFIRVCSNTKLGPNEGPEAITYERGYKDWTTGDAWYEVSDR